MSVNAIDGWFRLDMYPNLSFENAVEYINMLNGKTLFKIKHCSKNKKSVQCASTTDEY